MLPPSWNLKAWERVGLTKGGDYSKETKKPKLGFWEYLGAREGKNQEEYCRK